MVQWLRNYLSTWETHVQFPTLLQTSCVNWVSHLTSLGISTPQLEGVIPSLGRLAF